eukprot:GILJ01009908.1.p1 GENE.GILJ01009908.1~~GILJ01009908.1.p1  ORF type:complete len:1719 (+),score=242.82 GILJ01009908.1:19-5175(+)
MGIAASTAASPPPTCHVDEGHKQMAASLIRALDGPPYLDAERSAAYVVVQLSSNSVLRQAVKALLLECPSNPVPSLVASLIRLDPQTCSIWTMGEEGVPALAAVEEERTKSTRVPSLSEASGAARRNWAPVQPGQPFSDDPTVVVGGTHALTQTQTQSGVTVAPEQRIVAPAEERGRGSVWEDPTVLAHHYAPVLPQRPVSGDSNVVVAEAEAAAAAEVKGVAQTVADAEPIADAASEECAICHKGEEYARNIGRDAQTSLLDAFGKRGNLSLDDQIKLYDLHLRDKIIDRRFKILRTLGVGGFGAVFACSDLLITRQVAIKVNFELVSHSASEEHSADVHNLRLSFYREGVVMARLESPFILKIFHFGETATSLLYQIMELIEGCSLKQYLTKHKSMDVIRTVSVVRCMLLALTHAHDKGVVHCDLKPANLLLTDNNRGAKVIDWGNSQWSFAGLMGGSGMDYIPDADHDIRSDETIPSVGTPAYMSFEQIDKLVNRQLVLDNRSDLFSVGLIVYECLTGQVLRRKYGGYSSWYNSLDAYNRQPHSRKMKDSFVHETELLREWPFPRDQLGKDIVSFLDKTLTVSPEQRFGNAREMLRAVEALDPSSELPATLLDAFDVLKSTNGVILDLSGEQSLNSSACRRLLSLINDLLQVEVIIAPPRSTLPYDAPESDETRAVLLNLSRRERPLVIQGMLVGTICEALTKFDFAYAVFLCRLSFSAAYNKGWASVLECLLNIPPKSDPLINELILQALKDGAEIRHIVEEDASLLLVTCMQTPVNVSLLVSLLEQGEQMHIDQGDKDGWTALHHLLKNSQSSGVNVLLDRGAAIGAVTRSGLTPLHVACKQETCDMSLVRSLLERGAMSDINTLDNNGWSALHGAVSKGHTELALLLLDNGADMLSLKADTLLSFACNQKTVNVCLIERLLQCGAVNDINKPDSEGGRTPLHFAVMNGREDLVSLLLDNAADIDALTADGSTDLHVACNHSVLNVVLVRLLLERGAVKNINTVNKGGWTALLYAVRANHTEVVLMLLNNGADTASGKHAILDVASWKAPMDASFFRCLLEHGAAKHISETDRYDGDDPLRIATHTGDVELVRYVLDHGASVYLSAPDPILSRADNVAVARLLMDRGGMDASRTDAYGNGVFHTWAGWQLSTELASFWLQHGGNIHDVSSDGTTPLLITCRHPGNSSNVQWLLDHGAAADINKQTKRMEFPLRSAMENEDKEMVLLLLNAGANVNVTVEPGQTLLHWACNRDTIDISIIRLLLERGAVAAINKLNEKGYSPLHSAVLKGCKELVLLFLENGADVDTLTADKLTPFRLACKTARVNLSVVRLLLDRGALNNQDMFIRKGTLDGLLKSAIGQGQKELVALLLNPVYHARIPSQKRVSNFDLGDDKDGDGDSDEDGDEDEDEDDFYDEYDEDYDKDGVGEVIGDVGLGRWLGLACNQNIVSLALIRFLLERGAVRSINERGKDGYAPLHTAVAKGHEELVLMLLNNGANVDAVTKNNSSPLHLACKKINISLVRLLLDRCNVNNINKLDKNDMNPLHYAISNGARECVLLLLERGADVHAITKGMTPLLFACQTSSGFIEHCPTHVDSAVLKLLLDYGAVNDINKLGRNGLSPLLAVVLGFVSNEEAVSLLIDAGADIHVTWQGRTPLHVACCHHYRPAMVRLLLERGAVSDINKPDDKNETPLDITIRIGSGYEAILQHFLSLEQ